MSETLKRMNKGAQKVTSISGTSDQPLIFRGSLAFCFKDVQPGAMRSVGPEFTAKLNALVQSGENFVSSIYNESVITTAFPPLSRDFYRTLEKVRCTLWHYLPCECRLMFPCC